MKKLAAEKSAATKKEDLPGYDPNKDDEELVFYSEDDKEEENDYPTFGNDFLESLDEDEPKYLSPAESFNNALKKFSDVEKKYNNINNGLTTKEIQSIINYRNFANGYRKPISHTLTNEEIEEIKSIAKILDIPEEILLFNEGSMTGFDDNTEKIFIRGNILPDIEFGNTTRDKLSIKAVLAHEYYGHYKNHPSMYDYGDWHDEFRASYDAAVNAPNLSDEERAMLILDAYDRAKEAGIYLDYNEKAREILYGK